MRRGVNSVGTGDNAGSAIDRSENRANPRFVWPWHPAMAAHAEGRKDTTWRNTDEDGAATPGTVAVTAAAIQDRIMKNRRQSPAPVSFVISASQRTVTATADSAARPEPSCGVAAAYSTRLERDHVRWPISRVLYRCCQRRWPFI